MNILMITGDKKMRPGHPRFDLQAGAVERLVTVYWGRGSVWPALPEGPFDVVTVQDPFLRGLFAWRVARRFRAKFNVQVHTDLSAHTVWRRLLAKFVLQKADSVRVVSEKIKQQVETLGVRAAAHVLPVYIDIDKFSTIERKPHGQKIILWVGRFEDEKDPLLALSVLKAVGDSGADAKLVMLGAGSLASALKAHAHAAALPVTFPGWQDPTPYLAEADVVLCTSRHESWGASMVEALAAGVPVVAPEVGVAREAGAVIKPRSDLGSGVVEMLRSGARGTLRLKLPQAAAWAELWRASLI